MQVTASPLEHRQRRRRGESGQSLVELALIVPILLLMLLGIADLARVYATMITVESAAREAADFGAFRSDYWSGDKLDPTSNWYKTVNGSATDPGMRGRACVAANTLPDYVGPDDGCTNPSFAYQLLTPPGLSESDCANSTNDPPCRVSVTLTYDFRLFFPVIVEPVLTFERTSIFAISDFELDQP